MSFSPAQQAEYRALVAAAWRRHGQRQGLPKSPPEKTNAAYVDWYARELHRATGRTSTAECNAGRDYDFAMAHFEVQAGGGTKWQKRLYSGEVKRMFFSLRGELGEIALWRFRVDQAHLLNALRNSLGPRRPSELARAELITILDDVRRSVRRSIKHAQHIENEKAEAQGLWQKDGVWRERPVNQAETPFLRLPPLQ